MPDPSKHPYEPGAMLPGSVYRLGNVIGMGGTAAVFAAEDTSCGRPVVVKVLRPDVARRGILKPGDMEREARMLVALQQQTENVVEVVTAGVTGDTLALPYYVMEQLSGESLRATFDRRQRDKQPIAVEEVLRMGIDLAVALDHAHRLNIVHLDVKPGNAFVHQRRDGSLVMKLLDFGISTMLDRTMGGFRGTYRYAAPEQIQGKRVTHATDLYSLGVVLYEAVALRRPFDPPGLVVGTEQLIKAHCESPPPPLERLRPDAPPALIALVMRCLAKEPGARPPSAAALVSGLKQVLTGASHRPHPLAESLPYLVTLTSLGVPKQLQDALAATLPAPGGVRSGSVASLAPAQVPRSELFVTAPLPGVEAPRPVDADTGPHVTQSAAELPKAVPARRIPPLVVVAFALTAALIVGAILLVRGVRLRPTPQTDSFTTPAGSPSPVPTEPAVLPPPPPEPVVSAPPVVPPSTPPSAPLPRHHPEIPPASTPSEASKPTFVAPSAAPVPPPPPAAKPKPPDGITTQKDWF